MSEKINYFETEGWVNWFITSCIGEGDGAVFEQEGLNPKQLDIKMIVNGVECSLIPTLEHMGRVFDKMVGMEAKKLIEERWNDKLFANIDEMANIAQTMRDVLSSELESVLDWNRERNK